MACLIRAAVYLSVPPWELQKQGIFWQEWALAVKDAEDWAKAQAIDDKGGA